MSFSFFPKTIKMKSPHATACPGASMIARTNRAMTGFTILVSMWSAAVADPLTVTDMTGRTVILDRPAERVVTIPIPSASIVITLDGAARKLVGMHASSKDAILESVLGEFFPEAKIISADVVSGASPTGFAPNVEAIATLRPDLVVQWGERGEDLVAPLTNAGLMTGLIVYGTEQQARNIITFIGTAIGKPERVAALWEWRDRIAADLQRRLTGTASQSRPKVLYLLRTRGGLQVAGADTYNDFCIVMAGGVNAAGQLAGMKPVNAEQIAAWNPDVILLNNFEQGLDLSSVYGDPVLSQTRAALGKRVYRMPLGGYRWDPASQESPLAWLWLAGLLHPDKVDVDLRAEISSSYRLLYDKVPTEAQIDGVLHLSLNRDSLGYDRFAGR